MELLSGCSSNHQAHCRESLPATKNVDLLALKHYQSKQEAQLMLTTGAMRLAVSRGQQTWYHFGSVATFR